MTAPSGILVYSLLLIIKISINNPELNNVIQIIAYISFILSIIFTLIAILRFNFVLNLLLHYKGEK